MSISADQYDNKNMAFVDCLWVDSYPARLKVDKYWSYKRLCCP